MDLLLKDFLTKECVEANFYGDFYVSVEQLAQFNRQIGQGRQPNEAIRVLQNNMIMCHIFAYEEATLKEVLDFFNDLSVDISDGATNNGYPLGTKFTWNHDPRHW